MNDPNRLMKWLLVIGLVVLSLVTLRDTRNSLKGGFYRVAGPSPVRESDSPGRDRSQQSGLATKVMGVLKDRVDPKGQLNLEWRPVGNTRLEVRMPRPPRKALERRDAKEAALDTLAAKNLKRFDVEEALHTDPERRDATLAALVRGVSERVALLDSLKKAYDKHTAAESSEEGEGIDAASDAYEEAMANLLATNLRINRLLDVLALGPGDKRAAELEKLIGEFPSFDAGSMADPNGKQITRAVEAYDAWASDKADLEDPSDLKRRIKGAGVLEFRILAERDASSPSNLLDPKIVGSAAISRYSDTLAKRGPRPQPGDRYAWFRIEDPLKFCRASSLEELERRKDDPGSPLIEESPGQYYGLAHESPRNTMLRSTADRKWKLKAAYPDRDPLTGENLVSFALDPRGGQLFGELTGANIKKELCIMLDNAAMSYATINERITERCQISGSFTLERVQNLVRTLDAGSLPARVKEEPLMEKTIGPSLGETNRRKGITAAAWAAIAVGVFVLFYYGIAAGGMANLALAMNLLFVLAVMALLQATFTLPGIAGLILTVGMAIDANVLIFERIREERARGVIFKKALNAGYDKAFSTIMDANLTTLLTCIILGFVGSEEVKGFAITLGIGIVSSLFTSLFVTRLIFNTLIFKGWLKDLSMRSIIGVPDIDWLSMRAKFWPISMVAVVLGAGVFVGMSTLNKEAVYDIEFLGGTGVQIDLKPGIELTDEEVTHLVTGEGAGSERSVVDWLEDAAEGLRTAQAALGSPPRHFALTSVDGSLTGDELGVLMRKTLEDDVERDGVRTVDDRTAEFESKPGALTLESFVEAVQRAADETEDAALRLRSARVQTVADLEASDDVGLSFEVVTIETNRGLVQAAILATMGDQLVVQQAIKFKTVQDEEFLREPFFVVKVNDKYLRDVIGGNAAFDVRRFRGGVAVQVDLDESEEAVTVTELERRLREIVLQVDADHYRSRETAIFPLGDGTAATGYKRFAILAVDEAVQFEDVGEDLWKDALAKPHAEQVNAALSSEKSLSKVIQFAPQVAGQARNRAVFSIILALAAIVVYLSLRFGTKEYGLAAIVALVHDVSITLGLVAMSRFVAGTILGDALLIDAFRVDLPMIAAILTVIGYSLNDTIVVFDRIRENRGRIGKLSAGMINNSINQTLSRTLLTSITTFLAVVILYIFGGAGLHGFSFALMIGVIVGTYSSIGIATPLLYRPQLLRNVVTVIVALALIGITHLAFSDQTFELVIPALLAIACPGAPIRSRGGLGAGQPVGA